MPIANCGENCTSTFLPGGIETARKLGPFLNQTLLEGGLFSDSETIQIHNAPGLLLRFDTLPLTFDFDRRRECHTFGESLNDTLQVCIKTVNESLAVGAYSSPKPSCITKPPPHRDSGWAACPTPLYRQSACTSNTTWQLTQPLPKKVLMTRYKQYATTAYNGLDFSILNTSPTSPPILEPLNLTTYLAIFSKIFTPPSLAIEKEGKENDIHMTSSLLYAVTWLLRLYDDVFPDDFHTPLSHLRNFLAIPQQFMVTCLQFANYTIPTEMARLAGMEGRFALPDDMQTFATRGRSTTRFLARGWVVWVYVASVGVVVVGVGAVIVGMVVRKEGIPGSTGFVEVDLAGRFRMGGVTCRGSEDGEGNWHGLRAMRELGRARDTRMAVSSSFGVARELRKRRIRLVAVPEGERDGDSGQSRGYGVFAFREGVQVGRPGRSARRVDVLERADTGETKVASPRENGSW